MKIYLATDHAGFELKNFLKDNLLNKGYDVEDCGAFTYEPMDDYPDFIMPAAEKVVKDPDSMGIILGGSGQGEAMAANRVKGARAVVYYNGPKDIVTLSRSHNDANILSIGARFITPKEASEIVDLWLAEDFEGGRHNNRINKLDR
tara:strand:- start:163 stop:600 length:438 start_codon:yes stop_codon:yes gene_type:complete